MNCSTKISFITKLDITYDQWRVQRNFDICIPVYAPKLCVQINEKISLIQILVDKIFIAIVFKHCKKFNFAISVFCKKKNQNWTVFMLCFNHFLLPILNWAFCERFIHHYWFWCSLIIFRLETINPRNIWACLKDSLNVNMKLFPESLTPLTQALRLPASFRILLREKRYAQAKPWICHWWEKSYLIIDAHAYPETKQNNFYYNIKAGIHRN